MKINFQPSSVNAHNLRLQQPHFGRLSTAEVARLSVVGFFSFRWLGRSVGGGVAELSASCEIVIVAAQLR
ncbi:MAG: hypothetical protein IKY57_02470 [Alistipes sp.]|nr:hypothetical protein [Alistipes sp.]